MILGILDRNRQGSEFKNELLQMTKLIPQGDRSVQTTVWTGQHLALCSALTHIETLDEAPQPFMNADQTIVVVFAGKIYNIKDIKISLGMADRFKTNCSGEALVYLYEKYQDNFLDHVNGKFAFALWDSINYRLLLGRDRLGVEPLFYFNDGKRLFFSSSLRSFLATEWIYRQLNHEAVLQYLMYNYNPGEETLLKGIYKLPPAHILSFNGSDISIKKYWQLSFAETEMKTEEQYREEIIGLIEDAIRIRLDPNRPPGVFLSGGTDSSTIVSLTSRMLSDPVRTYSFRCEGRSYDESHYAGFIAGHCKTEHIEIPYNSDSLLLISNAVESMDEPFCDIGIEIATYLLGKAAQGKVSYIFSGEGGDELFGGHPVYTADKLAAVVDQIPRPILNPLIQVLQRIPDSDQKKNLQVKMKRFAYSLSFPPELLSHRWRIYYTPQELQELCTMDFIGQCDTRRIFDSVLKYNREADGGDQLSRSLYSDYQTLVGFYLRRLELLKPLSLESRLPLIDYRLIEYAAKIPSQMKIRGLSDTKYIYKKVLEGILPDEILYNRPKLGHSVPMKNWLRDDVKVREWIADILSSRSLKQRGFFHPELIQRMVDDHVIKTNNHSHRLWGLVVLELWLRGCLNT